MATTADYMEYVMDQLRGFDGVRSRKMFGEYMVYINEKPVLLVCDNIVIVKKLPEIKELMKDAECGFPYDGAKEHYIFDLESPTAKDVITKLEEITPVRKKKAKG